TASPRRADAHALRPSSPTRRSSDLLGDDDRRRCRRGRGDGGGRHVSAHLAAAIGGARDAESELLHELRKVGDRHVADQDVAGMCATLADRTQRRIDALDAQLERYGSAAATSGWAGWDHLVAGARRTASKVTGRT